MHLAPAFYTYERGGIHSSYWSGFSLEIQTLGNEIIFNSANGDLGLMRQPGEDILGLTALSPTAAEGWQCCPHCGCLPAPHYYMQVWCQRRSHQLLTKEVFTIYFLISSIKFCFFQTEIHQLREEKNNHTLREMYVYSYNTRHTNKDYCVSYHLFKLYP